MSPRRLFKARSLSKVRRKHAACHIGRLASQLSELTFIRSTSFHKACVELKNATACTPRATGEIFSVVKHEWGAGLSLGWHMSNFPIFTFSHLALRALNILLGLAEENAVLDFLSVSADVDWSSLF